MSDERFDQDLRSVLQEDAPRDVPDDLRRRVGAVPATHPATSGPTRPVWRHPVPLWIGVVSAIAVLLAVGTLQFRPAPQSSVGGAPSSTGSAQPSPSTAAGANSSPSPTPSHVAAVTACRAANLVGRILSWQGPVLRARNTRAAAGRREWSDPPRLGDGRSEWTAARHFDRSDVRAHPWSPPPN